MPLQLFERSSARHFIADTYAPLVVGEAGQLRAMIEDTLHNEFSTHGAERDPSRRLPEDESRGPRLRALAAQRSFEMARAGGHHGARHLRSSAQPLRRRPAAVQRAAARAGRRGAADRQPDARPAASRLRPHHRRDSGGRGERACGESRGPGSDDVRRRLSRLFRAVVRRHRHRAAAAARDRRLRPRRQPARNDDGAAAAESRVVLRHAEAGQRRVDRGERRRGIGGLRAPHRRRALRVSAAGADARAAGAARRRRGHLGHRLRAGRDRARARCRSSPR